MKMIKNLYNSKWNKRTFIYWVILQSLLQKDQKILQKNKINITRIIKEKLQKNKKITIIYLLTILYLNLN